MRHVVIIGAGELGGAAAHALARADVARTITLVDESGRVAEGKALDILQASPVEGFATVLRGAADVSAAAGADAIVVADRVRGGEWQDEEALPLLTSLLPARAIVVCAGAHARGLVDRGTRELKWPRRRLIGSAPEALAAAVKALVALALDGSARDVSLTVLGLPPAGLVVAWSSATFGGFPIARFLDEPTRRRIESQAKALWPPGPFALAAAATKAVAAITGRSRQLASCFVAPDTSAGDRMRTAALPVRLGLAGIIEVVIPPLSVAEKIALENAMMK